jgi:hypothetical protein
MPYTIDWLIENEIIYTRYSGVTTAEELRECLFKLKDLIESSSRFHVHIISDVSSITVAVPLKDSMRIVREVGPHPRSGWSITLGEKAFIVKMGAALAASIFRMRIKTFDTLDQAIEHLKLVDEMLTWEKLDTSVAEPTIVQK